MRAARSKAVELLRDLRLRLSADPLARNSGYIMATTVANAALGFAFWVVAAHLYRANTVGLAAAIVSAMAFTSLVCRVGADGLVINLLPSRVAGRDWSLTLNAALAAACAASLVGGLVVVTVLPAVSHAFGVLSGVYAAAFVAGVVAWTATTVLDYTCIAERSAHFMLLQNIVMSTGKLALLVPAAAIGATSLAIVGPWVMATCASFAIALTAYVPRLGRGYELVTRGIGSRMRQISAGLVGQHLINLSGGLPPLLLPVLVAASLSSRANAYFYTTWMVGSLFFVVSPAVASALFAEGSREPDNLRRKTISAVRLIIGLLVPVAVAYLVGGRLVLMLFGRAYASSGWPVLLLLLASALPDAVTNIYIAVMRVTGHVARAAAMNISIATLSLALALVLMPTYGIEGAALGWLLAQSAGTAAVGVHAAHSWLSRPREEVLRV